MLIEEELAMQVNVGGKVKIDKVNIDKRENKSENGIAIVFPDEIAPLLFSRISSFPCVAVDAWKLIFMKIVKFEQKYISRCIHTM